MGIESDKKLTHSPLKTDLESLDNLTIVIESYTALGSQKPTDEVLWALLWERG